MREFRRLPVGAEVRPDGVHFRVWAPRRKAVALVLEGAGDAADAPRTIPLSRESDGYFSGAVAAARAGSRYRFLLDGCEGPFPDPASRFQPAGPHGPSQVVDPKSFSWSDATWRGVTLPGQVFYELHIGTFTPQGSFEAARQELARLAELGVTVLEVMPVAEFPGRFGWGYDGVNLFAPTRLYGEPDDFRRFVDSAHGHGLAVILDVVYNHLGPDGNYLRQFADGYFTTRHDTEWGEAIDFDGPDAVRELFLTNAGYWIEEFHLDGLRLDATQAIFDEHPPPRHIVAELVARARQAAGSRSILVIAENEPQHAELARPLAQGGFGLDALWNDDFHHSATVACSGHREAYYSDYYGTPQELISTLKWGFLYQGQRSAWQKQPRGHPACDLPPAALIHYLQNHDQVANSARGLRVSALTSPGKHRAMTALLLLAPQTPMLFMGQEFSASQPFLYFADHKAELAQLVRKGRLEFLAQFPSLADDEVRQQLAVPHDEATFLACKLDSREREREPHRQAEALHRELLRLRREDPVLAAQRPRGIDGAVLAEQALLLRFFGQEAGDRLLLVNLGLDLELAPAPEPLLAPPAGATWQLLWSSESLHYGGCGTPPLSLIGRFILPGQSAFLFRSIPSPPRGCAAREGARR
jgi:maltooligosyltrehalose trehalohydrolase